MLPRPKKRQSINWQEQQWSWWACNALRNFRGFKDLQLPDSPSVQSALEPKIPGAHSWTYTLQVPALQAESLENPRALAPAYLFRASCYTANSCTPVKSRGFQGSQFHYREPGSSGMASCPGTKDPRTTEFLVPGQSARSLPRILGVGESERLPMKHLELNEYAFSDKTFRWKISAQL